MRLTTMAIISRTWGRRFFLLVLFLMLYQLLTGCSGYGGSPSGNTVSFASKEAAFDELYLKTPLSLSGQAVDEAGRGIAGAEVTLIGWGDSLLNNGKNIITEDQGSFLLNGLYRRSVLMRVKAEGYYDELIPLDLQRPLSEASVIVEPIIMTKRKNGRVRVIFAGDTMFGRRYIDKDEDGIEGEPEDLIQPGTRARDAKALTEFLLPVLHADDHTTVNFESPVITDTSTKHPYKTYTFFSYPETLEALGYAGVDSIGLGNNHVYDYLEPGFRATISNIQSMGIDWFGAGFSESDAARNFLRKDINGVNLSFQGFNGIRPDNFPEGTPQPWPDEYMYSAMDTPIVKGGSLWLSESNISTFLDSEAAGRFAVPVIHGGDEYGEYPSANIRSKIIYSASHGAGIVVAHHPHTTYGIGVYGAGEDSVYALLSLGNFLFDQDVFESFQAFLAIVDIDQTASGKHIVQSLRLIPFHLEGYVPKLVAGEWLARIGRQIGHLSTYPPPTSVLGDTADGLRGAVVFPANNRVVVLKDSVMAETQEVNDITLPVVNGHTGPFIYPRTTQSDMLSRLDSDSHASCNIGRELMHYGDFEDMDIDGDFHEGDFWNQTDQRFFENSVVRSGTGALAFLRKKSSKSFVTTWFKNRITFPEAAKLTLAGYLKGDGAGEFRLLIRWYVRDSREIFLTEEDVYIRPAGTYDWEPFHVDLTPPANAGTVRAYLQHYPPKEEGNGLLFIDDLALINWEESATDISGGFSLNTPNNWSWLRCYTADPGQQSLQLSLTHRFYSLLVKSQ